ncbi:MAG: hypothetical protein MI861_08330, partial [Pirellulales bacterium]|nr:hypothetical protein [Pirellulales bacterium]
MRDYLSDPENIKKASIGELKGLFCTDLRNLLTNKGQIPTDSKLNELIQRQTQLIQRQTQKNNAENMKKFLQEKKSYDKLVSNVELTLQQLRLHNLADDNGKLYDDDRTEVVWQGSQLVRCEDGSFPSSSKLDKYETYVYQARFKARDIAEKFIYSTISRSRLELPEETRKHFTNLKILETSPDKLKNLFDPLRRTHTAEKGLAMTGQSGDIDDAGRADPKKERNLNKPPRRNSFSGHVYSKPDSLPDKKRRHSFSDDRDRLQHKARSNAAKQMVRDGLAAQFDDQNLANKQMERITPVQPKFSNAQIKALANSAEAREEILKDLQELASQNRLSEINSMTDREFLAALALKGKDDRKHLDKIPRIVVTYAESHHPETLVDVETFVDFAAALRDFAAPEWKAGYVRNFKRHKDLARKLLNKNVGLPPKTREKLQKFADKGFERSGKDGVNVRLMQDLANELDQYAEKLA